MFRQLWEESLLVQQTAPHAPDLAIQVVEDVVQGVPSLLEGASRQGIL